MLLLGLVVTENLTEVLVAINNGRLCGELRYAVQRWLLWSLLIRKLSNKLGGLESHRGCSWNHSWERQSLVGAWLARADNVVLDHSENWGTLLHVLAYFRSNWIRKTGEVLKREEIQFLRAWQRLLKPGKDGGARLLLPLLLEFILLERGWELIAGLRLLGTCWSSLSVERFFRIHYIWYMLAYGVRSDGT